ncbi:MAG TPA: signal recognition particle-docking protein FtsY [Acidimicrobiales bacterium]|nr:signal recognition particle-docking protein FtsY [Acidimicrobiales bacterium]
MIALWIALAVVLVALMVGLVVAVPRRRRGAGGSGPTPTVETGPPRPTARPPRPVPSPAPSTAPGVAEEPGAAVVAEAEALLAGPEAPAAPVEPAPPELRERMGKTRGLIAGAVRAMRSRGSVDGETWEELEEALLRADVGVATTSTLLDDLRARVAGGDLRGPDAVVEALRQDLRRSLDTEAGTGLEVDKDATTVWLFVGVNGVGKTTTIGKVARRQTEAGHSVLLAAGDTFRAAAGEQLELWAERAGVEIVRGAEGGDPSAVVFDAVQRAAARGNDLVLADTAGRLHTKVNLVEELKKIRRVADRPPGKVMEVLLVLDATTGQNGLAQARQFLDAVGVTGVVLTKLDGSAKGGIVVAIQRELGIPVKLVGLGEGPGDLVPFDPDEFVTALFE